MKGHGNAIGGEEDADDAELAGPAEKLRKEHTREVDAGVLEDLSSDLRLLPQACHLPPEDADQDDEEKYGPEDDQSGQDLVRRDVPELDVEGAGDGQEEVEVDERAGEREEDLLHKKAREDAGEGRSGDEREEDEHHHEGADVRRQEPVQRYADRVRREDGLEGKLDVGIRVAQYPEPSVSSEGRLTGLHDESGDEIAERDARHLVPEVVEPRADVPPEQIRHDRDRCDHERDEYEPNDASPPAGCRSCDRLAHRLGA